MAIYPARKNNTKSLKKKYTAYLIFTSSLVRASKNVSFSVSFILVPLIQITQT